jgi:hypothetical protein
LQNLIFISSGFGIVMSVLVALWGVCAAVGYCFKMVDKKATITQQVVTQDIPPAHVAAITAAVATLSSTYRIISVDAPPHLSITWASQGRHAYHAERRTRMTWAAPHHAILKPHRHRGNKTREANTNEET